ncbi:MAG: hypothetical protein ACYC0B_08165 [Gemmatimonadaceae bacterium]
MGYIVMALVTFAALTLAWVLLGADGAFRPGVFDVSMTWILITVIVGIVAALAAGRVARMISKDVTGPRLLAALIVIIGVASAIHILGADPVSPARTGAMPMFEAISQTRMPLWAMLVNTVIGGISALMGGNAMKSA